jgi:hypothetical protein
VDYLNPVPVYESREISSTLRIKRVSQRQRRYVFSRHVPRLIYQRGVRPNGEIDIMAPTDKAICEIRKMSLATAERLS